jgi:hypothetical protein
VEVLLFAVTIIFVALAATIVVQGVRYYQASVPARDYRYLEQTLEAQKDQRDDYRAALEQIAATRYAGGDPKATHDECVAIAAKALGIPLRS